MLHQSSLADHCSCITIMFQALAWHPSESGCLCIGGGLGDASLSLWNVNKLDPEEVSYRHVDFFGAVENLAWNKSSGELVVHWSYWVEQTQYTAMPVLASLDRSHCGRVASGKGLAS